MRKIDQWMDDNPLKTIAVGSGLATIAVLIMILLPYLAHLCGPIMLILALSIDVGLCIFVLCFCAHIGIIR